MSSTQNIAATKITDGRKHTEGAEMKSGNVKENSKTGMKEVFAFKHSMSGNDQTTIDAQVRDWFRSLSSEERSGATQFSDRAFIGTLLALATPWSTGTTATTTSTTTTTQTNEDHVRRSGEYKISCRFYVISGYG